MLNIKATLSTTPTVKKQSILCIQRGASASISYDLSDKIYNFDNIEQLTFMLKQANSIHWFQMFTYLVPTEDTVVIPEKAYYTDVALLSTEALQCVGSLVETPVGNPKAQGYFEIAYDSQDWQTAYYIVDPRFNYIEHDESGYITLLLYPEETKNFKPTTPESLVACEVAVRLNTDDLASLGNADTVLVETLPPMAVVDTIYSKLVWGE